MVLDDIPEPVVNRILELLLFMTSAAESHYIRLVNKKLATMALPALMHTIHIDSPAVLARLVRLPLSPLYHAPWVSLVRCLQFSFNPDHYVLQESITSRQIILPQINTVRFKYTQGTPIREHDSDETIQALLSTDYLRRAANSRSNTSWLAYLSGLRPKRFEWITDDPTHLRLVPIPAQYRKLFDIWGPSAVLLDGICPVQQSDLSTWAPLFLAKRTHIRGRLHTSHFYFLSGFPHLRPGCEVLVLEKNPSSDPSGLPGKAMSTLIFGTMLIQLIDWTKEDRHLLKLILTGKTPARPLLCEQPKIQAAVRTINRQSGKVATMLHMATFPWRFMIMVLLAVGYQLFGGTLLKFGAPRRAQRQVHRFKS
ncbi:hypothetical protein D9619_001980 [Psilocybe cf. subviscida]|uniref:Uncharacterized protein n=1 Tax=Psilocybe cf. subviscida TaxID=2480587 RepID=A0A8H5BEV9_9AGAR|nr:hypothetical protein D9619_001980 [Psilocybe cf. subviscida]